MTCSTDDVALFHKLTENGIGPLYTVHPIRISVKRQENFAFWIVLFIKSCQGMIPGVTAVKLQAVNIESFSGYPFCFCSKVFVLKEFHFQAFYILRI